MTTSAIIGDQLLRELALAIARNQVGAMRPTHEVIAGEGITQTEYDLISQNPQFQRYVDSYCAELRDNGFSFEAKARVLAEGSLPMLYHMAHDSDTPAAVRRQIVADLVEWGKLKPKNDVSTAAGPGFSITINIPNTASSTEKTIVLESEEPQNTPKITQKPQKSAVLAALDASFDEYDEGAYE